MTYHDYDYIEHTHMIQKDILRLSTPLMCDNTFLYAAEPSHRFVSRFPNDNRKKTGLQAAAEALPENKALF